MAPSGDDPALRFDAVALVGEGRRVLDGLSFTVARGERLAIVGRNGQGKTLIARLAAGLLRPTGGKVEALGERWGGHEDPLRRRVGVSLGQTALLSDLTASENVRSALGAVRPSAERRAALQVERALYDAGADHCADRPIRALSLGERRRVDLARALASNPELLILDDVLAGVDRDGAEDLLRRIDRLLSRSRRALLWLGGDGEVAAGLCGRVLMLENGRLGERARKSP